MADEDARIPEAERVRLGGIERGAEAGIELDMRAWRKLAFNVLKTEGLERMTRVRDACRADSGCDGYMLSTEGEGRLPGIAPIVTVITTDADSVRDNATNGTLLRNFALASG